MAGYTRIIQEREFHELQPANKYHKKKTLHKYLYNWSAILSKKRIIQVKKKHIYICIYIIYRIIFKKQKNSMI